MKGFFSSEKVQKEHPIAGFVPRCGACGLFKTCVSPKMQPYGEGAKKVLVLGESPGEIEDERNRPFVGKSGQFLRQTLAEFDIDLDRDAWTTNSLICHPEGNKTPDEKQISYCRPNLLNAIRLYKPRVIVTLGRSALVSAMGQHWPDIGPMEKWVGWRIPFESHWICPTYHPSYLLRMKNSLMDRNFADNLRRAFKIEKDPPKQTNFDQRIEIIYDERVEEAIEWFDRTGGWMAADYETTCLKPELAKARIVSCALSNGERTISFPWTGAAQLAVGRLFKSKRTRKIASNLKFEERWTRKFFGHGVRNWCWDTMLAAHCLDNRQGITSLKFQAFVKMGVPSYNEHIHPFLEGSPYNRIDEIEIRDLLFYGGMDALLEYMLAMIQRKEMGYAR